MKPVTTPSPRAAVAALPAYVAGRRAAGARIAPLASNESHFPPLPEVAAALQTAQARVNRYPDMASATLRDALAADLGVTPAELAVGPGSVGVLGQIVSACCDPGDEVVFAWRSFEAYPILCQIAGATAVRVPLRADEGHDLAAMLAAITDRTRVVLLCSPNNPTGVGITEDELQGFLQAVPGRVLVVLDEAYREYSPITFDSTALYRSYPNLCLLRTFSKAYGLAGLRVGYAVAHEEIAEGLRRTQIPFSVSNLAEAAAVAALGARPEVERRCAEVVAERERVIAAVRERGWTCPDSAGNFFWLRTSDDTRERLMAAFDAADILVRGYAGDGIRVTIADAAANDRVIALLDSFSRVTA